MKKLLIKQREKSSLFQLWPIFFTYSLVSVVYSVILINIVNISGIIWPYTSFHVHAIQSSLILSVRSWMWAIAGLFFGLLADRFNRKILFIITTSFSAFSCILFGIIPNSNHKNLWNFFIIASIIAGIGLGGNYPLVHSISSDFLTESQRSQFFGIYYALNLILSNAGMILSAIAFKHGWWRIFFIIIGLLLGGSIVILIVFLKEPPRAHHSSKKLAHILKKEKINYNYQLNRMSFRQSILTTTNIVAIIEGIFTCILFDVILFLIIPYLKEPPINLDSNNVSILFVIFALPAIIISVAFFAQKVDRWAQKGIKIRVDFIIISVTLSVVGLIVAFLTPLDYVSTGGQINWGEVFKKPSFWLFGIIIFTIITARVLYLTNQPPVLQAINLPEAQGFISSVNQFLEIFASGLAPLVGAAALKYTNNNFLLTALICSSIGIPGIFLWIYARTKIINDIANIQSILEKRADVLHQSPIIEP
ncbi:MFS transporter [Candidatus Harpocratesius sp.]